MPSLSQEIDHDHNMWGDGTRAVFFGMLIDGDPVDDISVDPDVFFEALARDGTHPLLMCPTGVFDCCGMCARTAANERAWNVEFEGVHASMDLTWSSVIEAGRNMHGCAAPHDPASPNGKLIGYSRRT